MTLAPETWRRWLLKEKWNLGEIQSGIQFDWNNALQKILYEDPMQYHVWRKRFKFIKVQLVENALRIEELPVE